MTKKIEKLTPEQEIRLVEFREEWRKIGLNTKPANKKLTETTIKKMYEKLNYAAPEFIWCKSPMACQKAINKAEKNKKSKYYYTQLWGQLESYWIAFYIFCNEIGAEYTKEQMETLKLWENLAKSCFWWYPFEGYCFISDRPKDLRFDDEHRLHSETGPAILFSDGYALYSWHGTQVPKKWIENKTEVDPKLVLNWENIEQRRCLAEILGWDKVLEQLDYKIIDTDKDPMIGELLEVKLPDSGKEQFLKVRCGTGRDFVLPVGTGFKTAIAAQAAMWDGLSEEDIRNYETRT